MCNDPLTELRMRIMKASDLVVISITLVVFAMSMLFRIIIDDYVNVLSKGDLTVYGQLRASFDASTINAYLGMTTWSLCGMALVYWGIRKMGTQFGTGWDVVALAWFFVIAFFSVPSGIAHWVLTAFDPNQFAPARFIGFLAELKSFFLPDEKGATGQWIVVVVKSGMAIALPTIYLSTFWHPLKSVRSVRVA